jgi:enoyl-CoA hydratase/carnithine racemase
VSGGIVAGRTGAALRLRIDRPEKANALTAEMAGALRAELEQAGADPGVRAVLLCGTGGRVFCSGFDLGGMDGAAEVVAALMEALDAVPVPTIAVLDGHAVGAGLELACRCDLRVARAGVEVGLPAVRIGVHYRPDGLRAVAAATSAVRRLLLTGERLAIGDAPGLADRIVPASELDAAADALVAQVAQGDPAALAHTTRALRALRRGEAP